jgi:hypothetical protein
MTLCGNVLSGAFLCAYVICKQSTTVRIPALIDSYGVRHGRWPDVVRHLVSWGPLDRCALQL